jgi:acyl-CoA dehydrogenase
VATLVRHQPDIAPRSAPGDVAALAAGVGAVAAAHAAAVDRDARFPHEAVDALREARLLGALVPRALGGRGATLREVADACHALAQHCANAAMVFAMHQIQVACLVRHGGDGAFFRDYLAELAERELLIASATSEVGVGGDVRSSVCAVVRDGGRVRVEKQAPVISYGEHADDVLLTARRSPDAAPGDQLLLLARRGRDLTLERTSGWDTLGFRGTCSAGFRLTAECDPGQLLPTPYADISAQTMLPVSHVLWGALWLGIATAAVAKARTFVRAEARKKPGTTPPAALRLAELVSLHQTMRANVNGCAAEYEHAADDADALAGVGFALRMNNLKLAVSQQVVQAVGQALGICGIAGYREDSPYALGRQLRDAHGAALMINNDRLYAANAAMLLVHKDD